MDSSVSRFKTLDSSKLVSATWGHCTPPVCHGIREGKPVWVDSNHQCPLRDHAPIRPHNTSRLYLWITHFLISRSEHENPHSLKQSFSSPILDLKWALWVEQNERLQHRGCRFEWGACSVCWTGRENLRLVFNLCCNVQRTDEHQCLLSPSTALGSNWLALSEPAAIIRWAGRGLCCED